MTIPGSSETATTPSLLRGKPHFEVLDGLRGMAAIAVVVFHFMEVAIPVASKNFIGHGFLAVDFFFCLSGFVIAYAYDNRIQQMGLSEFFKSRLIRLHPLVVLGSVLGLIALYADPFGGNPGVYSAGRIALIWLCSVLLIPFPVMKDRAFNLFGLNAPSWSLFWEYIANIVYALILCRINKRWLIPIALAAGIGICLIAWQAGAVVGGWDDSTFWHGGVRVSFSFTAGMMIYRYNWIIKNKLGFLGLSFLLALAFVMPFSKLNWFTEPVVILLYLPLLIALGAGTVLSPKLYGLCRFSGNISYPLYMTHYAIIWMFANYYSAHKPDNVQLTFIVIGGIICLTAIASLFMTIYDIPVRRYLNVRFLSKKQ